MKSLFLFHTCYSRDVMLEDLPGALAASLVQRILGVQTYGLVVIDPRCREVLYKILLRAVAEATTD